MLITKTKHQAALAEKDATIEGLMRRLELLSNGRQTLLDNNIALRARLAPFERVRGAGGRFVKANRN